MTSGFWGLLGVFGVRGSTRDVGGVKGALGLAWSVGAQGPAGV